MKFIEIFYLNFPISNEEYDILKKIKNNKIIFYGDLNEREKILSNQLLKKGLLNFKIIKGKIFYEYKGERNGKYKK